MCEFSPFRRRPRPPHLERQYLVGTCGRGSSEELQRRAGTGTPVNAAPASQEMMTAGVTQRACARFEPSKLSALGRARDRRRCGTRYAPIRASQYRPMQRPADADRRPSASHHIRSAPEDSSATSARSRSSGGFYANAPSHFWLSVWNPAASPLQERLLRKLSLLACMSRCPL